LLCETRKNGNQILEIHTDEHPRNPREWSNLGIMACGHRDYILGDVQIESQEDYDGHVKKAAVALPLFLYDHSGLSILTGPNPFDERGWDTSPLGVIYATREGIREYFDGDVPSDEAIREILEEEIEYYNKYLSGDCYRFVLYEPKRCDLGGDHREEIDSCGGFYDVGGIYDDTDSHDWEVVQCQQ